MAIDATNPVVALCAAGMDREGTPDEARRLFEEAWDARRDDYDASIAAHFLARHQATPADTLHWNALAVRHAEAVPGDRADELKASLYLNLGDSYAATGNIPAAIEAANRAVASLDLLPAGGYREFVEMGIRRLQQRLDTLSLTI
jgi:tetratricopeptide (TPR) repeat protein